MLLLIRRPDESIIIDGNIKIKILGVRGDQVRLGFEAPDDVTIVREELLKINRVGQT